MYIKRLECVLACGRDWLRRTLSSCGYRGKKCKTIAASQQMVFVFLHSYENKSSTSSGKQKPDDFSSGFALLAVRTGLEPATHGVTGRYSNQLNYRTIFLM